jgi:hypothetical protein
MHHLSEISPRWKPLGVLLAASTILIGLFVFQSTDARTQSGAQPPIQPLDSLWKLLLVETDEPDGFVKTTMTELVQSAGYIDRLDDCSSGIPQFIFFVPNDVNLQSHLTEAGISSNETLDEPSDAARIVDAYLVGDGVWDISNLGDSALQLVSLIGETVSVTQGDALAGSDATGESVLRVNGQRVVDVRQACNGTLIAIDGALTQSFTTLGEVSAAGVRISADWEETQERTSSRNIVFSLRASGCSDTGFGLCSGDIVSGLTQSDLSVNGSAPGCALSLDTHPDGLFTSRSVFVRCQGPGTVQLVLAKDSLEYAESLGPSEDVASSTIEIVDLPILRVQIGRYAMGESGNVTSEPPGINCGTTNQQCEAPFPRGQRVRLIAAPGPRNVLVGWTGSCSGQSTCAVVMREDVQVGASFLGGSPLSVTKVGTGSGTVRSQSGLIDCGSVCSAFSRGSVTLTARAASRSVFRGWFGGGCSGTGTCTTSSGSASVFAVFDRR